MHWQKGFFAQNGGFEFPLVLAVGATAVAFAGAGDYSLDGVLGWSVGGEEWGVLAAAIAAAGSALVLASRGVRLPRWRRRSSVTA